MSTFGTLQAKILDDMNRTDITAQVQDAIVAAVKHYEKTSNYWFQEERKETTVVPNQAYYALPSDYLQMRDLTLTEDSDTYALTPQTTEYIEERYEGFTARPQYYKIFDDQIRLYPTPDSTATLNLFYQQRFDSITATASYTSNWFIDGYELIRHRATYDVAANTLHDDQRAMSHKQQEMDEKAALNLMNVRRKRTGRIKKYL